MMNKVEILGICATILITLSYAAKGLNAVRIINIIGSVFFVAYGLKMQAYSVWIANSICIVLNIVRLWQNGFSLKDSTKQIITKVLKLLKNY